MRRLFFYIFKAAAFMARAVSNRLYMRMIVMSHKSVGVHFEGKPDYIHTDAYLDPSGGLRIGDRVVISTGVIILTHDWSFLVREDKSVLDEDDMRKRAYRPVVIGEGSFIGAGAIILPGTTIGRSCIVGAGAVVKGGDR